MENKIELVKKFRNKSALIGVIGLGYVGLPLALRYTEVGYTVLGFDIDQDKINALENGRSYIGHISKEKISSYIHDKLKVTTDFSQALSADALIICVPTPLNKWREPDLIFINNTMDTLLPYLRPDQVISLQSTTYPGTTHEVLRPRIENKGFLIGENFYLVYSPEREDPGNQNYSTATIPKIVGGTTPHCLEVGIALYEQVINQIIPVSSTRTAEMTKLLENIHRAVNIGLINELKIVADKMGVDIYEIIHAAATKPFGFVPYYPGPGLGGHCIPIDPFYLTWKAREYGIHTRFIELAGQINRKMPEWVVEKIVDGLNNHGKALRNSQILVLGLAYKSNIDDVRESPAVEIIENLVRKGANVSYSDPHVPHFPKMREHHFDLSNVSLTEEILKNTDCVVIATAHNAFDFSFIKQHAKLIIDTRGVYRELEPHIIRA